MMNFYEAIECMKKGKYCSNGYSPYMYIELVTNKEQEKGIQLITHKEQLPKSFPYFRAKLDDGNYVIWEPNKILFCKYLQDWYECDKWGHMINLEDIEYMNNTNEDHLILLNFADAIRYLKKGQKISNINKFDRDEYIKLDYDNDIGYHIVHVKYNHMVIEKDYKIDANQIASNKVEWYVITE